MASGSFPAVGAQLPRRGGALSRGLGRAFLRLLGWRVTGQIPDLPKMVWIGAPHTTNWDGVLGLATLLALGVDASTMIKDSAFKGPLGWLLRGLRAAGKHITPALASDLYAMQAKAYAHLGDSGSALSCIRRAETAAAKRRNARSENR